MSEIKYYDGGYKDIIMSIPTNTIEMTAKLMYEDGETFYAKQIFNVDWICPKCGWCHNDDIYVRLDYKYCPMCGERMVDDGEDD